MTERENVEACRLYKPIPIFLQKAVLNPPDSIRKNPYKDNHRDVEPNYQAPLNPLAMALNAEGMYKMNAKSYLGVYNKLINEEIEKNRNKLDRDLEEVVDEDAPGHYYFQAPYNPLNLGPDEMVKVKKGNLRGRNYHKDKEQREEQLELQLAKDMYAKGIAVDPNMKSNMIPVQAPVSQGTQTNIPRPRGRPPKDGVWDSMRGYYVIPENQIVENTQPELLQGMEEDIETIEIPPLPGHTYG